MASLIETKTVFCRSFNVPTLLFSKSKKLSLTCKDSGVVHT